ncbi:unnamed protein product, partial [Choristocarpus tenellus]
MRKLPEPRASETGGILTEQGISNFSKASEGSGLGGVGDVGEPSPSEALSDSSEAASIKAASQSLPQLSGTLGKPLTNKMLPKADLMGVEMARSKQGLDTAAVGASVAAQGDPRPCTDEPADVQVLSLAPPPPNQPLPLPYNRLSDVNDKGKDCARSDLGEHEQMQLDQELPPDAHAKPVPDSHPEHKPERLEAVKGRGGKGGRKNARESKAGKEGRGSRTTGALRELPGLAVGAGVGVGAGMEGPEATLGLVKARLDQVQMRLNGVDRALKESLRGHKTVQKLSRGRGSGTATPDPGGASSVASTVVVSHRRERKQTARLQQHLTEVHETRQRFSRKSSSVGVGEGSGVTGPSTASTKSTSGSAGGGVGSRGGGRKRKRPEEQSKTGRAIEEADEDVARDS